MLRSVWLLRRSIGPRPIRRRQLCRSKNTTRWESLFVVGVEMTEQDTRDKVITALTEISNIKTDISG